MWWLLGGLLALGFAVEELPDLLRERRLEREAICAEVARLEAEASESAAIRHAERLEAARGPWHRSGRIWTFEAEADTMVITALSEAGASDAAIRDFIDLGGLPSHRRAAPPPVSGERDW